VAWMPGQYILMLDDIRAPEQAELAWLVQSPAVQIADLDHCRYRLVKGPPPANWSWPPVCPRRHVSDSTARARAAHALETTSNQGPRTDWRLATVFDAWNRKALNIAIKTDGPDAAT